MLFDREISTEAYAMIRFGMGYPVRKAPVDAAAMLDRLNGPDQMAKAVPFLSFEDGLQLGRELRVANRIKNRGGDKSKLVNARKAMNEAFTQGLIDDFRRALETDDPFRERLHAFWVNHFTAKPNSRFMRAGFPGYASEAIRAHMTGHFAEMLKATVTHPFMLMYLDQSESVGPNSEYGQFKRRGLNENLAREVLELHSLGADGGYSQADVTQFAELLTGLNGSIKRGFSFLPARAEPGAETILGKSYGGNGKAKLADIHRALEDLAVHPSTARHISFKLAAHFVADAPDADLVAHMTDAYRASDGHLATVYAAMLDHPAAWSGFGAKVKRPLELMITAVRAIGAEAADMDRLTPARAQKALIKPLKSMGQPYLAPPGPDGWPDEAADWVHAHGMAGRIGWVLALAQRAPRYIKDPRAFAQAALGDAAGARVRWAAGVAETRATGIALVLASAEFNRR